MPSMDVLKDYESLRVSAPVRVDTKAQMLPGIVEVVWEDAQSMHGWNSREAIDTAPSPLHIHVGYVIESNEQTICLAFGRRYDLDDERLKKREDPSLFDCVIWIPRTQVRELRMLGHEGDR